MICKTKIDGFFIDAETTKTLGLILDVYHDDLEIELTETKKDLLTHGEKNEIISKMVQIEHICRIFDIKGYF